MLTSGDYGGEMIMAYDKNTKNVTGYFESYTGLDEETKHPKFSCIFYLEGKLTTNKIKIKTYYPKDSSNDLIVGELQLINDTEIKVHLPEEHGGCWNVRQFADEPVDFTLNKSENWLQLRYATKDKVYFYSDKSDLNKLKAYILKGDIVAIEKIEGQWSFCTFKAKKTTIGWMKLEDLNRLE